MPTVVCFGDSITWGCPPYKNSASVPVRMPKESRWPQVMAAEVGMDIDVIEDGLSARTTVFDDPVEGEHKNGSRLIVASIETHAPLDLLIIMLGTNDFKDQFRASAFTSARGVLTLVQLVHGYYALADHRPEILIVTPPSLTREAEPAFYGNGWERCRGHADYLQQIADRTGCFHFDCNSVASVGTDGIHLDVEGQRALGRALAPKVASILKMSGSRTR
ncbi:GDSL-type esterase/lipase family protein [Tropicimonas sp. IMCC34011]|uniref:GDSL-type esterase/lipase family protein n=1 Tax=Tropicimonas sp. IMCC34011 TaxID=2248759 RepID=UPI000E221D96|nr:GDSL-type esterase/lipase family protein [Tropicimonas sp. IMCC34011]